VLVGGKAVGVLVGTIGVGVLVGPIGVGVFVGVEVGTAVGVVAVSIRSTARFDTPAQLPLQSGRVLDHGMGEGRKVDCPYNNIYL
jgi:hypothetical protein